MQEGAESCGEDAEKNYPIMAPSNNVNIRRAFVDVCSVNVKANNGADGNHLGRQG